MPPLVSAIILNYRNPQVVVHCAERLLGQTVADCMEIIIVDNHSADDSIGVLRNRLSDISNVRLVETPQNLGFGGGYNRGVSYASGRYILINNPEKVLQGDGVEKLFTRMENDNSIGILAPALLHDDGTRRYSIRAFPSPLDVIIKRTFLKNVFPERLRRYLRLDADTHREQDVEWVVGGCFMISHALFSDLGGFDDRFFLFFEDTDFCRRVRGAGKRIVYFPAVTARDKKRRLSGEGFFDLLFSKTGRIHLVSAWRYFGKWGAFR